MKTRFVLIGLLLLSLPVAAWGWGADGHVIVGKIAESQLTPAARAAIKELLDDRSLSDVRISTWADEIRRSALFDRKYKNHPSWHYINLELKVAEADFKPKASDDHVLAAIERFRKIMVDPAIDKTDRKEAFMFVIHFVGDFHQPLHACNREDDKGGNLVLVKRFLGEEGKRMNLHSVWDTNLVLAARGELSNDDFAKRLAEEIKPEERKAWLAGDASKWVWESHSIGVKNVYQFSDGSALPKPDGVAIELTEENYVKANRAVVREQLKKAGVRLAQVLNDSFADKKSEMK